MSGLDGSALDAAWLRSVITWLVALPALNKPEIVVERFGGRFEVDDHNPNRIEYWLIDADLPQGVSVRMSWSGTWRILVISCGSECAVTLADVEPLVEDLPARFEVNHASFDHGPQLTGTTHSFRVPAGKLSLSFRMPQHDGAYADAVRAAYSGHAEPKPTLPELLESLVLSVSEENNTDAWEGLPSLRQLRDWAGN